MKDLNAIFSPSSIAVIGASSREGSVGQSIFRNLLYGRYTGVLYPVNPKARSINGVRCYPTVAEVPDPFDLAILIIPAPACPQTLRECVARGAKGAVIISAGFKEIGGEGVALEEEVKAVAREAGVALVGPNCLGVINTDPAARVNASFAVGMPAPGSIAFISQSGALCTSVLDYAKGLDFGFSKFISIGNKADVNELDLLRYLHHDPETRVILMYLEDLANGYEFIQAARAITSGEGEDRKPIIAIKSGTTAQGAKAASSHTGSLASSDEVYDAIFTQAGILRVERIEDLFDLALGFSQQPLPRGRRVAIVTNAGGPGIMATDACIRYGLELAHLEEATVAELKRHLPPTSNFNNPVDVIGDAKADRYEAALNAVIHDPGVDGLIVILTPQSMTEVTETARKVVEAEKASDKPVLANFMGIVDVSAGVEVLKQHDVPHFMFPESAAKTLAAMVRYTEWCNRPRTTVMLFQDLDREAAGKAIAAAEGEGRSHMPELEALEVFRAYRLPTLPSRLATTADEALEAAEGMGYPVVLKVVSADIVHKLDVGGVAVGLENPTEMLNAWIKMQKSLKEKAPGARVLGINVQKMAPKGLEMIVGVNRNPKFGPVLMFGLGGTYVEALQDVTFRLCPIRELGAHHMIEQIRASRILGPFRGKRAKDKRAMAEIIMRTSQLVMDFPQIRELDMNPVFLYEEGEGAMVADARIILGPAE
ncbi:MAG TPA: acyl-CoA synthetase [Syntrophus sp. (in: bacteria)]|nr:acyl-CoA synthetase [Syntrophus sp. (in: bacteria)]